MDILKGIATMRKILRQEELADHTLSPKEYVDRHDFNGLAVYVCAEKAHDELFMFLPTSKDGQDVDDCPKCGASVFESWNIFPLWLTDEDPYEPNKDEPDFVGLIGEMAAAMDKVMDLVFVKHAVNLPLVTKDYLRETNVHIKVLKGAFQPDA